MRLLEVVRLAGMARVPKAWVVRSTRSDSVISCARFGRFFRVHRQSFHFDTEDTGPFSGLRLPRCVSTGPVVVRLAERANKRERDRFLAPNKRNGFPTTCLVSRKSIFLTLWFSDEAGFFFFFFPGKDSPVAMSREDLARDLWIHCTSRTKQLGLRV